MEKKIEKADVFVVSGFHLNVDAAMLCCEQLRGGTVNLNTFTIVTPAAFSVKTECMEYEWVFYVENFFGQKKVTRIFRSVKV